MNYNTKTNLNDLAFEFYIPKDISISNIDFKYLTKEWDGVLYNQGLPINNFGLNYILTKTSVKLPIVKRLPEPYLRKQWDCISVQSKGLQAFANELMNGEPEEKGRGLKDLIESLLNFNDIWVVVFEPDHDDYEMVFKKGTKADILNSIVFSLTIEKKGFVYDGESVR